jgi:hypothetical protein
MTYRIGTRDGLGSFSGKVAPRRAGARQHPENCSLKFTGNLGRDRLIPADNARYEGTAGKPCFWVLKRVQSEVNAARVSRIGGMKYQKLLGLGGFS